MTPEDASPLIILTGRALKSRRSVDPTAWFVLEELAIRSKAAPDPGTVSVEVRSLAATLGRSKDAVGRAIQALIDAGLVERRASRDEMTGQFGSTVYRIDLHAAGLQLPAEAPAHPTHTRPSIPTASCPHPPSRTPLRSMTTTSSRPRTDSHSPHTTVPLPTPQTSVTNLHSGASLGPDPGRENRVRTNRTRQHRHGGARPC